MFGQMRPSGRAHQSGLRSIGGARHLLILVSAALLCLAPWGLAQDCKEEVESNDILRAADFGGVVPGVICFRGEIAEGDVDVFAFEVVERTSVTLRTILPEGGDTTLLLTSEEGLEVAFNDDASGTERHSLIVGVLPPGLYYATVGPYRAEDAFRYELEVIGEPSTGPEEDCEYVEVESNDELVVADPGGSIPGAFCYNAEITPEDVDMFTFEVTRSTMVALRTALPSGGDTTMSLMDVDGQEIAYNDDAEGGAHSLIYACLAPGIYFVRVAGYHADAAFSYVLAIEGEEPCDISSCTPPSGPDNVIVTPLTEEVEGMTYVGETVTLRIRYFNPQRVPADVLVHYPLDSGLSDVTALDNGQYDPSMHAVTWHIPAVGPCRSGTVSLQAVVGDVERVAGEALIRIDGEPDQATNPIVLAVNRPRLGWIPLDGTSDIGAVAIPTLKEESTIGLMVHFDIPGMYVYEVEEGGRIYHRLQIPGRAPLNEIGKPELPILGAILEVPYDVNFSINVVDEQSVILDGYNVYPAQELPQDTPSYVAPPFTLDAATYMTNQEFPGERATLTAEDIGIVRGHRIVLLKVNPLQYNPATRELRAFSRIEVQLRYDKPGQIMAIESRLRSAAFEGLLEATVLNYKPADLLMLADSSADSGSDSDKGCDYLIITHGDFYDPKKADNPVVKLRNWKRQKGYVVEVVDVSDIPGGTSDDDIRSYLQTAYTTWGPPPTYVLIVGDSDRVVTHYDGANGHSAHANSDIGTDLYYTTLDGTDIFPDLFIGRLSVDTLAQAEDVIDKIIAYEKTPPAQAAFYTDATLIALFEDLTPDPPPPGAVGGQGDGREERPWIENVEEVFEFLDANGYNPTRLINTSGTAAPARFENGANMPAHLTGAGWNDDAADIATSINAGPFLVVYRDHGGRTDWSNPFSFDINVAGTNDITGLTNGARAPVVFSLACENGWFDNETDAADVYNAPGNQGTAANAECFSEAFLRHDNGGTVAIISGTRITNTGPNDFLMFGLIEAIWPAFTPNPPITGYPAIPARRSSPLLRMGPVHTYGKLYMANAYSGGSRRSHFEMYHLLGDPEMAIWTEAPPQLDVDHPDGIGATGVQDFIVTVKEQGANTAVGTATVSLTRGGSTIAVEQTNAGGIARFTEDTVGAGNITITVTAFNYRAYQGTIEVNAGGGVLNRLDPSNHTAGATIRVGGQSFSGNESVDIFFGSQLVKTVTASSGQFGQTGVQNVDVTVPATASLGLVNVVLHGKSAADRYAVDVFQVRSANPIDLYSYSQWDKSTWSLHSSGKRTWNSPSIQLYETATGKAVESNNLSYTGQYTIKATIYNGTAFAANNVRVTFKWANYGVGQPIWTAIGTDTINVPAKTGSTPGSAVAEYTNWTPPTTGHVCILAEIYHVEDTNTKNNAGQENCHVGTASSPAEIVFEVSNPTNEAGMVCFEIQQIEYTDVEFQWMLWPCWVEHPDPQWLAPGETRRIRAIVDAPSTASLGATAEFVLTAYLRGEVIGGINFIITKQ